jgi:hypothetical protein
MQTRCHSVRSAWTEGAALSTKEAIKLGLTSRVQLAQEAARHT